MLRHCLGSPEVPKVLVWKCLHQPLVYLSHAKVSNARLMRWAILLQPYRFRIVLIKGSEKVGADCLSRL